MVFPWVEWLTISPVEYWFIKTKVILFIHKMMAWLKLNEIRNVNKMGSFNKGEHLERVAKEVFALRCFYNSYKNSIKLSKYVRGTK